MHEKSVRPRLVGRGGEPQIADRELARQRRQRGHIPVWLVTAHDLTGIVSDARGMPIGVRITIDEAAHIGDGTIARRIRYASVHLRPENLHIDVLPELSRIGIWDG